MKNENFLGRSVVTIVLAGCVLGVAHNEAGRMSHPPRGIPWVAARDTLVTLESLLPQGADTPAPSAEARPAPLAPAEPKAAARPSTEPGSPAPAASASRKPSPATSVGDARATAPDAAATATPDSPPAPATPAAEPPRSAPVPFIPEVAQPVEVRLATVKSLFDARAALFLDARDPAEYEAGHIPGATRLMRDDALGDPDRVKALAPRTRPIVAYCEGGACENSHELAKVLVEAGYRKVLVYSGGFPEWTAAGYPVERGGGQP